jgi:hypothetical protein
MVSRPYSVYPIGTEGAVECRMADRTLVTVAQGPNEWRLIRTDRDGASEAELADFAAAAVRWFIRGVGPAGSERGPLHELIPTAPHEWRFGWVRPLRVIAVGHQPQAMSPGRLLADRAQSVPGTVPTVRGQTPWFILLRFWWRAPDAKIEFPAMREGTFGRSYELNGADWVLDRAVQLPPQPDPGDQTWGQETGKNVAETAADLGKTVLSAGLGLGVVALLVLWAMNRR